MRGTEQEEAALLVSAKLADTVARLERRIRDLETVEAAACALVHAWEDDATVDTAFHRLRDLVTSEKENA